ncbi:NYN domain-containing protein [Cellulomonas sp. URHB0016]
MTDPGTDADAQPGRPEPAAARNVPASLRTVLVQVAADVLGTLEPPEVPATLRAVRQFAPRRRATAGAGPLWTALADDGFRARVWRTWTSEHPEPGAGEPPPRAPSWDAAAGAWLAGDPGWSDLVPTVPVDDPAPRTLEDLARAQADVTRLRTELERAQGGARDAADELTALQRELRRLRSDADRARSEARRSAEDARAVLDAAQAEHRAASQERAAAADDRRTADAERTAARAELRSARKLADARVRLLLDTIVDAASGLRTELALPPAGDLPADLVAPALEPTQRRQGSRGRSVDDPALLDELLRQPRAHLLVDGYNVSKSGFGELTLAEQRNRLVDGLGRVAARTGAEVTCCFDGQEGPPASGSLARGVRVLFSVGEIADDLIRRLVHAEPRGRVLVVVTSDQEVARDVEAAGAWVVPSATLVARILRP